MDKADTKQISGTHYKTQMECWNYIIANDLDYLTGNAIKYLTRWRKKNGIEDLRKAQHYVEKLIETELAKFPPTDVAKRANVCRTRHKSISDDALVQLFSGCHDDAPAWSSNLNTEAVLRPDTGNA